MSKKSEQALDPAYTDGPFFVVEMPINADGQGPEMDPAKVQMTLWEVWNPVNLSLCQLPSKPMADWVVKKFNAPDPVAVADMVARQLFLLTDLPPGFCAQIGLLTKGEEFVTDPMVAGTVNGQLTGYQFGRTADDVANFCADVIEAEAPEAAARLRGFFR